MFESPNEPESQGKRKLHPLPRGPVELYGLLAVLFVLVPEWMAGGALLGLPGGTAGDPLPVRASAWRRVPELRLASLSLAQLRHTARRLRLWGYAGARSDQLSARVLRRLKRTKHWERWLPPEL